MISIREYEDSDWEPICQVHDRIRPDELRGSCDPRAFVPLAEDTGDEEDSRRSHKLIARDGERVAGFARVDGAYVSWLYLDPDHHGRGIGRRLLRPGMDLAGPDTFTVTPGRQREGAGPLQERRVHRDGDLRGRERRIPLCLRPAGVEPVEDTEDGKGGKAMRNLRITSEPHAGEQDAAFVRENLALFNVAITQDAYYSPFAIFLRDERGAILGGALGDVWGGWLDLTFLWVAEPLRGQGYGKQLLEAAQRKRRYTDAGVYIRARTASKRGRSTRSSSTK